MYCTFMQEKSIQLKHVNTKSLHEINFLHNERLDSVFLQPHMQTYMLSFFLSCRRLFEPLLASEGFTQTGLLREHDAKQTNA